MSFNSNELIEKECETIDQAFGFIQSGRLTWINIDGLHDTAVAETIGKRFNIHGLVLEDMLNTLSQWEKSGVRMEVLRRTVGSVERERPDRRPDLWGD